MYRQQIIDRVNDIIGEKAGFAPDYIEPEDFYDELGTDSMKCFEALIEIGDEFVINIPGSRLLKVRTMQDVYDVVDDMVIKTHGFQVY